MASLSALKNILGHSSSALNRCMQNMPQYIRNNVSQIENLTAKKTFESLFIKASKQPNEQQAAFEYVDDILSKFNMCTEMSEKQKALDLLNCKKMDFYKRLREAEDVLDSVNERNGLYTSLGNICTKGELKSIEKELNEFYNKVFCKQIKIKRKTKIAISNEFDGEGCYTPYHRYVCIKDKVLTNPVEYKVVDKAIGKTVDDTDLLWQMHGLREDLQSEIKKQNMTNVELVPMNRTERIKALKSTVAHENFHSIQFDNMLLHPEIGYNELNKCYDIVFKGAFYDKKLEMRYKRAWKVLAKSLILTHKKLEPNSELATLTKEQFDSYKKLLSREMEYARSATEIGAYNKERAFAIKNDLLI